MRQASDKHFRCTVCQRGFTRVDHLKRHHLRHSGLKPYSCIFCGEAFARCDNLRDHYPDCSQRGDRQIPETGQRGRRRHACESCTSMKLRCDGESPCSSCIKRNLRCNNQRKEPAKDAETVRGPSSTKSEDYDQSSDRGSIGFLLNGGTDSFTERFHLPPRSDRARGLAYHNQKGREATINSLVPYGLQRNSEDYVSPFIESELRDLSFFGETFANFISGPFGEIRKTLQDPFTEGLVYPAVISPGQDENLVMHQTPSFYEPESSFAIDLITGIVRKAWTIIDDFKVQQEISANLHFLLTTNRIRKFVGMYFRCWHHNCPILHPPSFDPTHVPTPLLASVVFMGAMYSNDEPETFVAKRMLDFAELFVFSTDTFACENEVYRVFNGMGLSEEGERRDWLHFEHFQAGYLMLVIQYWAGSRASRNRAMESRFSEIVRIARSIGLTKCRHLPEDQVHETLWIQKEAQIRTINIISLLDCAFSFYQNYPCRLTHKEMECDLPCEESLFRSDHPFIESNFRLSRDITVFEAFQSLFTEDQPVAVSENFYSLNHIEFTVLDMFILIHLLYAFINSHMTLLIPYIRIHRSGLPSESSTPNDHNHRVNHHGIIPEDCITTAIRVALARWRTLWMALRTQVPSHEWAALGFFKNSYNFWLVAQLLITKKDSVDVVMRMEVKCEDKLEKLKVLLYDDPD